MIIYLFAWWYLLIDSYFIFMSIKYCDCRMAMNSLITLHVSQVTITIIKLNLWQTRNILLQFLDFGYIWDTKLNMVLVQCTSLNPVTSLYVLSIFVLFCFLFGGTAENPAAKCFPSINFSFILILSYTCLLFYFIQVHFVWC